MERKVLTISDSTEATRCAALLPISLRQYLICLYKSALRKSAHWRMIRTLVRESAWLALRPHIAADIHQAIALLTPWVYDESPFIRRFAVESTRPKGVWCKHIKRLRENPHLGLPLLEPLQGETVKYVKDSVRNWKRDGGI